MWYTVDCHGTSLGVVELPTGLIVAGRLQQASGYASVAATVRRATDAFIQLGLFGAAAPLLPPISSAARLRRAAMAGAARLPLELISEHGTRALTHFVNLLEAPADGGVIVLASFVEAAATVGAPLILNSSTGGGSSSPTA